MVGIFYYFATEDKYAKFVSVCACACVKVHANACV